MVSQRSHGAWACAAIIGATLFGVVSPHVASAGLAPGSAAQFADAATVETVTELVLPAAGRRAKAAEVVTLVAFGRRFELDLIPNEELFAPGAKTIWMGASASEEGPQGAFYQGWVRREPDSWVRVGIRDGLIDGVIHSGGETYMITPARAVFGADAGNGTVMFAESAMAAGRKQFLCGVEGAEVAGGLGVRHAGGAAGAILKNTEMAIVGDYEWFQGHGANSAFDMQSIMNQVDAIFQGDLGVRLSVVQTIVWDTIDDPFTVTNIQDSDDLHAAYAELPGYAATLGSPSQQPGLDLVHIFSNRGVASGVAGLCGVCDFGGVGLSVQSWHRLVAHEIGHNFCAPHDGEVGSPCSGEPNTFIMGSPGIAVDHFSPCTQAIIVDELPFHACLNDTTAVCGNNVIDAGEQCDDGNASDGDCCTGLCQYAATTVVCRPAAALCDVAETCTGSSGSCPADTGAIGDSDGDGICDPQDPCQSGLPIAPAKLKIKLSKATKIKGEMMFAGPLVLDPLTNGSRVLLKDSTGLTLFDATIPPGAYDAGNGSGWKSNSALTSWKFASDAPIGGSVSKLKLSTSTRTPGRLKLKVSGRNGIGPFDAQYLPVRATVIVNTNTGACGETNFSGCVLDAAKLTCE